MSEQQSSDKQQGVVSEDDAGQPAAPGQPGIHPQSLKLVKRRVVRPALLDAAPASGSGEPAKGPAAPVEANVRINIVPLPQASDANRRPRPYTMSDIKL